MSSPIGKRDSASSSNGAMDPKSEQVRRGSKTSVGNTAGADQLLENLGYKPELSRNRSTLQVAFMSFVLASIPYGLATTLVYPLIGGGPVNIIWGWVAVSLIIVCVAASLGEITSVYPTAGGVYYQAFMLAPARWRRIASWICGWLYVVGNITITLAVNFGTALFFVGCINVFEKKDGSGVLSGEAYQVFLIFLALTLLCNAVSSLGNRWLPWIDTAAIFWTFAGVIAIVVCVLAIAKNGRHDAKYVFTHFEVNSGWPDGWSFCVGLLHAAYATSSTGMIISMCEEVQQPSTQVPKAMVATIFINTFAGLLFLIPLVFVLPDITELISSAQPVPVIIKSAVGSSGGAFGLVFPSWSSPSSAVSAAPPLPRDASGPSPATVPSPVPNGGPSMAVQIILGVIYFGSSAAFNAFSGVGVICLTASYATPIAISLATGRKQVKTGSFYLGTFGTVANVIAIAWSLLALPLFCMPSAIPVTAETVNYAPVVFVFACLVSGIWYWVWGHKNYAGPPTHDE
ncbi:hypothetical protein MRS44_003635 [Fusarium solani]|uniref:uncharacterized protein n=1 Tax=Fusarium solani TaxID=169388 RepID=UPI0032C45989|nr:hypothetical protein MRS44_003635 [Fusarium solani]